MDRKLYVDYIKAIGIILVILGHINFANEPVKEWIYSFHMPLFFFATGLTTYKKTLNKTFVINKIQSLMVPYFVWGLIYSKLTFENVVKIGYGSYNSISSSDSLTSLWFLPAMFISVMIIQLLLYITKKPGWLFIISIALYIIALFTPDIEKGYPWCVDVSLIAAFFIILGYLFENYLCKYITGLKWYILLCIIGGLMTLTYSFNPVASESYVLMANKRIGDPIIFLISSIGGCIMTYGFAKLIQELVNYRILSFIGTNTLVIFVIQKPIIAVFEKIFSIISIYLFAELIITCIGTLVISCILCVLINRFVPCLSGKYGIMKSNEINNMFI